VTRDRAGCVFPAPFFPKKVCSRTLVLFLMMLSILAGSSLAGEGSYVLTRRDLLFAVHFIDDRTGFVVGNKGLLLRTENAGGSWTKVATKTDRALNDVTFVGEKGWIVGQGGMILHSGDAGNTWNLQESGCENSLLKIAFVSDVRGVCVGESGTILSTEDGGGHWNPVTLDWMSFLPASLLDVGVVAPNLYDMVFIDAAHGWIVGDNGIVLASSDGGQGWELLRAGPSFPPLFSVWFKDLGAGWAAGQNGTFLRTVDGGKTWEQVNVPARASLFKVIVRDQCGLLVGNGGTVLQTIDGGATWRPRNLELVLPFPWFGDAWIWSQRTSAEAILVGRAVMKKLDISGQ
jgi:photosystem II stability/assembly factor-like uncharacterized protein